MNFMRWLVLVLFFGTYVEAAQPRTEPENFLAYGTSLSFTGGQQSLTAQLYAQDRSSYRSVLIVSPGGEIPATALSRLAEQLARQEHIVFVLEYPGNLAVRFPQLARDYAIRLQTQADQLLGLPAQVLNVLRKGLPYLAFGHSLGGAVLGSEIAALQSPFDRIILMGVSQLIQVPTQRFRPVYLLLGDRDGLAKRDRAEQLAQILDTPLILLPDVNHFCIITDPNAGNPEKKAQDLPSPLDHATCVRLLVGAINRMESND